ncbi:Homeobox transcription factor, partial [Rasamsonia emersonii CBS 393.64]
MSVPEPSVTTNSSSPPQSNVSESSTPSYAFLVHSQKTLTQNLPPRVDNKLLARQKRRRTSPEDHAILEAEYQKNPKPDKAARASIVSRVALGEKEVQIWFQNRRQNDRRKSKPLQPHELVAPRAAMNNSTAPSGNDNGTKEPQSSSGSDQTDEHEHAISGNGNKEIDTSSKADADSDAQSGDNGNVASSQPNVELVSSHSQPEEMNNVQSGQEREKTEGSCAQSSNRKRPFSNMHEERFDQKEGPDANGRAHVNDLKSPPSLRISMSFDGEAMVRREGEPTPSPPKARTAVRISMSSDGEALIRTEDEPSPSKNRMRLFSTRAPRLPGLRRSTSAINFPVSRPGFLEGDSKPFGRSRDSRTWELYCDTDARSALSTPSSSQSVPTGGTPGLYRRHRSLTRSSFSRPNILTPRPELLNQGAPVEGSGEKRRKLSRAVSSLGRLESSQKVDTSQQPVKKGLSTSGSFKESEEDIEWQLGDYYYYYYYYYSSLTSIPSLSAMTDPESPPSPIIPPPLVLPPPRPPAPIHHPYEPYPLPVP